MTSPLDRMIDAACGISPARAPKLPKTYECACGQVVKTGEKCATPERCAILWARAMCACSRPGDARRACAAARSLKTPCRCLCHARLP